MVTELETVLKQASTSPEAMWRSRILMRSAQDAQRDLQQRVHQQIHADGNKKKNTITIPNSQALVLAQEKLQRDWNRTRQQFHKMVMESQQRQLAELSLLSAKNGVTLLPQQQQQLLLQQERQYQSSHPGMQEEKEDFFDRAMRERQEEIERISQSMKTINDIYTVRKNQRRVIFHVVTNPVFMRRISIENTRTVMKITFHNNSCC
jgi:hypothetical protein